MITEFFLNLFTTVQTFVLGIIPDVQLPSWFSDAAGYVAGWINQGANLGVWVPWALVGSVTAAVLGVWLFGLAVKSARWLLGLLPTMGGG